MARRRHLGRFGAALAAACLFALAGCATAPAADPTTPSADPPAATSAPSDTPSPTPSEPTDAADPKDPATWVIDGAGIGPIRVPGDFAATLDRLPETWTNDANCSWSAFWNAPDAPYGVHFVRGTEADDAPIVLASASATADAITPGAGPRTADGLGIGSTAEEVLAAYPDAEEGTAAIGEGRWLRVAGDGDAGIFFEFAAGAEQAHAVTVTTLPEPPYEVCG